MSPPPPPDTGTPITYEDVNQLLTGFGIAMLLMAAVVVVWVVGEERKIGPRGKNKNPTHREAREMTWDFALGVLVGLVAAAGVPVGIGYERFRLAMAKRPATKPDAVLPDDVVAAS